MNSNVKEKFLFLGSEYTLLFMTDSASSSFCNEM